MNQASIRTVALAVLFGASAFTSLNAQQTETDKEVHMQAPGDHNPRTFDIWSYGADTQPGGSDTNGDIGNWEDLAG